MGNGGKECSQGWESRTDHNWQTPEYPQRGGYHPKLKITLLHSTLHGFIWGHCQIQAHLIPAGKVLTRARTQAHRHPPQFLQPSATYASLQHIPWIQVQQTVWLQTANLLQESSSLPHKHGIHQADGCKTSRPLLANMKLIKDSINQPMINNFTREAAAVYSLFGVWKLL